MVERVDSDASDPEDDELDPTAAQLTPPPELNAEEERLARALLEQAERVAPGTDAKLDRLAKLLNDELAGRKVVVFTEYRDTLLRLETALAKFSPVLLHGGLAGTERRDVLQQFTAGDAGVLLATDAASEGLNLHQRRRLVVNLELPWTPLRLEQRVGHGVTRRFRRSEESEDRRDPGQRADGDALLAGGGGLARGRATAPGPGSGLRG